MVLSRWCASEAAGELVKNADAVALPLLVLTQRTAESSRNLYFPRGPLLPPTHFVAPQT